MGLLDAKEYDPRPAQRRLRLIAGAVAIVVIPLIIWFFFFRFWPEKSVVNKFFAALERQDFDSAYAIYKADPDWKQHPERYNDYPLSRFKLDWGPSGDYGQIRKHSIDCVLEPPKKGFRSSSGVIVVVIVNGRSEPASLWVEKASKTITQSPFEVQCHPPR